MNKSYNKRWVFVGISHQTKKIPIPGISDPRDIPNVNNLWDENPEMERNSESWGLKFRDTKNFYTNCRLSKRFFCQKDVEILRSILWGNLALGRHRFEISGYPEKIYPNRRNFGIFVILQSGFFGSFLWIFTSRSPEFWDFLDFALGIPLCF